MRKDLNPDILVEFPGLKPYRCSKRRDIICSVIDLRHFHEECWLLSWEMNTVSVVLRKGIFKLWCCAQTYHRLWRQMEGDLGLQRFRKCTICALFQWRRKYKDRRLSLEQRGSGGAPGEARSKEMREWVGSQGLWRSSLRGWGLVPDKSFLFPGPSDHTQLPSERSFRQNTEMPPLCCLMITLKLSCSQLSNRMGNLESLTV